MIKLQMIKYFTHLDVIDGIESELLQMHEEDLHFVFGIILPEESNTKVAVKEFLEWKRLKQNQDTMKK
jgi:hypothetical protein